MKLSRGLSRNNNGIAARTATIAPTPENTLPKNAETNPKNSPIVTTLLNHLLQTEPLKVRLRHYR